MVCARRSKRARCNYHGLRQESRVGVLTHDLDFGAILAATRAEGPSVVQIRTEDVMSDRFVSVVSIALTRFESELTAGALVIVDEGRSRVRILPLG